MHNQVALAAQAVHHRRIGDALHYHMKLRVRLQMRNVGHAPGGQIVNGCHTVAGLQQRLAKVTANKANTAGN